MPFRYPLAIIAWLIILDPVGFALADYIQKGASPFYFPNPINALIGLVLGLYLFYTVRYLRLRVVKAEASITPIMSGGEAEYHAVFKRLNSNWPVIIILTLGLDALTAVATGFSQISFAILDLYNEVTRFFILLAFITLVWEYCGSSWGLHKIGQSQLRLKSFLEDRFMGARALGNVALSLTIVFLVGVLLLFLSAITFIPFSPELVGFFLLMLAIGIVMFFLPLNSLHANMQAKKSEYQYALAQKLLTINPSATASNGPVEAESSESGIKELVRLKNL